MNGEGIRRTLKFKKKFGFVQKILTNERQKVKLKKKSVGRVVGGKEK